MMLNVKGGENLEMFMKGYITVGPFYAVTNEKEMFEMLKERIEHPLSVTEIAHDFGPKYLGEHDGFEYSSIFVIQDAKFHDLMIFKDLTRGYKGGGPMVAAQLDAYFGLLGVPKNTYPVAIFDIEKTPIDVNVNMRQPQKPHYTNKNIETTVWLMEKSDYNLNKDLVSTFNNRRKIVSGACLVN